MRAIHRHIVELILVESLFAILIYKYDAEVNSFRQSEELLMTYFKNSSKWDSAWA